MTFILLPLIFSIKEGVFINFVVGCENGVKVVSKVQIDRGL